MPYRCKLERPVGMAPRSSSRRCSLVVPGIGTIHGLLASSQASASSSPTPSSTQGCWQIITSSDRNAPERREPLTGGHIRKEQWPSEKTRSMLWHSKILRPDFHQRRLEYAPDAGSNFLFLTGHGDESRAGTYRLRCSA